MIQKQKAHRNVVLLQQLNHHCWGKIIEAYGVKLEGLEEVAG